MRKRLEKGLAPCIIGAFFCFLFLYYGVGEYPDSVTYMTYHSDREPLYPLFLMACRALFGSERYLRAAVFLQNAAAFFATWYLYRFLVRQFALCLPLRAAALLILLVPHLLTGVFASSGIILTNAILSEGLTVPLYPLFVTLLLEAFYRQRSMRYWAGAYAMALLLSLARGQLMPLLLVWAVAAAAAAGRRAVKERKSGGAHGWRRCLLTVFLCALAAVSGFALRRAAIAGYHAAMSGSAGAGTGGNVTLLTNVLYSADARAIEEAGRTLGEEDRALLDGIYEAMKSAGLTAGAAGEGFLEKILHHEDSHDKIKFDVLYEALRENAADSAGGGSFSLRAEMDETAGRLMRAVLPHSIGAWLKTYFYVAAGGFIRTVSLLSPLFSVYALMIYVVAVALMWYLFKRGTDSGAAWMMAAVLLMTAANVCATSLTIMCLSRYMIYNMQIFYLALAACVQELLRVAAGKGRKQG